MTDGLIGHTGPDEMGLYLVLPDRGVVDGPFDTPGEAITAMINDELQVAADLGRRIWLDLEPMTAAEARERAL